MAAAKSHTARLDPVIHQPTRLGIMTAVCEAKKIDFVSLRELLDVTDGNLSRHLSTLEAAGYIQLKKTFVGRKPSTSISATKAGRAALRAEIETLRQIVANAGSTATPASANRRFRPATS